MSASENRMKIAALGQAFAAMAPGTWGERAGTNLGNYAQALAEKEAQKEAEAKEKSGIFGKAGGALGAIVGNALLPGVGGIIGGSLGSAGGQALGGGGVNAGSVIGAGAMGGISGALSGGFGGGAAAPGAEAAKNAEIAASSGNAPAYTPPPDSAVNLPATQGGFFQRLGPAFQAYSQASGMMGGMGMGGSVATPPINGYIDPRTGQFIQNGGGY